MTETTFRLRPIDPSVADVHRSRGGPRYVADAVPGYPCRQCLRDAEVGEELILVSHDPFDCDSPFRSASPIFLHRHPCRPYVSTDRPVPLPEQLTRRQLSVRSFDRNAMMIDAAVIDGEELAGQIEDFFTSAESERIHVHNASRGCWAATVERQPPE